MPIPPTRYSDDPIEEVLSLEFIHAVLLVSFKFLIVRRNFQTIVPNTLRVEKIPFQMFPKTVLSQFLKEELTYCKLIFRFKAFIIRWPR